MSTDPRWIEQRSMAEFDGLLRDLGTWTSELPDWPPYRRARALWSRVASQLQALQARLDQVLVIGLVGGSGTGKSTLLNAIVGRKVSAAGDVERPTTRRPVVIHHPTVDPSFLELDDDLPEQVALPIPLLEQMILVDCPDPDTEAIDPRGASDDNRNRQLLRRLLPKCDVLLHVATAQKYKTQAVAAELLAHAPGRQVLFIQTHSRTDADIRADWQRHLEASGFRVPVVFRVDSEYALERRASGQPVDGEFASLLQFLTAELTHRASHRIKRANALDQVDWFLADLEEDFSRNLTLLDPLEAAISAERDRLFKGVLSRIEDQLRGSRQVWRSRLLRQVSARWGGGPFAAFLRVANSFGTLVRLAPLARARGLAPLVIAGGVGAGKALAEQWREQLAAGEWISAAELGISEADLAESQSIVQGAARAAGLEAGLAGSSLDAAAASSREALLDLARRLHSRLESSVEAAAEFRTRSRAGGWMHALLELLFFLLPGYLLGRLGYNFFFEHSWQGKPLYGLDFVGQAVLWTIVWGLLLRGLLIARLEQGVGREVRRLADQLTPQETLGPLFEEFAAKAARIRRAAAPLGSFRTQVNNLRKDLTEGTEWRLGRLEIGP